MKYDIQQGGEADQNKLETGRSASSLSRKMQNVKPRSDFSSVGYLDNAESLLHNLHFHTEHTLISVLKLLILLHPAFSRW